MNWVQHLAYLYNSSTQQKVASSAQGRSKRGFAMTHKTALKFIVLATIAIALGIMARPSAVEYFTSTDQARAKQPVGGRPEIAVLPNPQLSRVRLLVSNLN
jgi:hypothetical protein